MNKDLNEVVGVRRRKNIPIIRNLVKANEVIQKKVKNIDIYSKIHDDYCVKSTSKSIISLAVYFIILLLTLNEVRKYFIGEEIDNIGVDKNMNNKIDIKIDITFPSLRCEEISVDTVDNVGENQVDARDEMIKIPIDLKGNEVHSMSLNELNTNKHECMSCYGAETSEYLCCNDCESLKLAYRSKGWSYLEIVNKAPQCLDKVGCRVNGIVQVNKVSGNVHIALGKATIKNGKHVHEFNMNDISRGFNTSHIIHELRFGTENIPFIYSPLENIEKIVEKGTKMFHYYLKLIPIEYIPGKGKKSLFGNQYTYTQREKEVHVHRGELSGLPGIFIVYDFQPFILQKIHYSIPLSHLFTSFCAIVGGIYSIMSLIDSMLMWILKFDLIKYFSCIKIKTQNLK